jgi:phosphotriesterase-related protein
MGCGYYVEDYQDPSTRGRSVDDLAGEIVGQVRHGAWGTRVQAGIIGEIGCTAPWTKHEQTVMRAAILAQQETGAALNVHPGRHADQPQEIADFVRAHGGDLARTVISHIDRTIFDEARLLRLADSGVVLEFDLFGQESSYYPLADIDMPNDAVRLRHLRTLIAHGHGDRVVISHDICYRTRLTAFGGHGYAHIFENVVPMMRRRGFTETEIDAILIGTPRRLLTLAR